jgi:hypothetical protein
MHATKEAGCAVPTHLAIHNVRGKRWGRFTVINGHVSILGEAEPGGRNLRSQAVPEDANDVRGSLCIQEIQWVLGPKLDSELTEEV